ncbi:MAG: XamI family restriction endonuclease [Chloroflexi bacterium]|nr:MAG: XamI family restriction endonuclease [Chloroflexota bacterium]
MKVNANKPDRWKKDIVQSIDFYNDWFMRFAPAAYRKTRSSTTVEVTQAFTNTHNLAQINASTMKAYPQILAILRMTTAPPLARDRLIGLAGISPSLVSNMEQKLRLPPRMSAKEIDRQLKQVGQVIDQLLDRDLFPWLDSNQNTGDADILRAATVVADRLCGSVADPIIRNAQEQRQLATIRDWLKQQGYREIGIGNRVDFQSMEPGQFSFRLNVPVMQAERTKSINIPVDAVIKPKNANMTELPLLIEAKSAGDFTNTNKRRKEEAAKMMQLRATYGQQIRFVLFLCGYFDTGYLGYEAAEGIDWVWEHRPDDLLDLGL